MKLVDLELELVHETEKAVLLSDGDNEQWVPKSLCEIEEKQGSNVVIATMKENLAIEKGFV